MFSSVVFLVALAAQVCATNLTIQTSVGKVTGLINSTTPHVRRFWGVPFAQPPVGDLRWTAPAPLLRKNASINATSMPATCSQSEATSVSIYTELVPQFYSTPPYSEDCLYLNIYAPLDEDFVDPLPVFIWIHGGGFQTGGLQQAYQMPMNWVNRTKDLIVVSVNYRLNIFGFPNAAGLNGSDMNLGLMDQRLAVKWVKENIAAFGGDPQKITLWGQSAGAAAVDIYNYAYADSPMVNGFIADSGVAEGQLSHDFVHSNFTSIAKGLGCGNLTAKEELKCMKAVSAQNISNYVYTSTISGKFSGGQFFPIPDGKIVFTAEEYAAKGMAGNYSNTAMIMGSNSNEGASFAPFNLTHPNFTEIAIRTKDVETCPVSQSTGRRASMQNPNPAYTFRYQYQGNFTNVSPAWWMGAYHSAELPLIFGTAGDYQGANTPVEDELSQKLQDIWVLFGRDGGFGLLSGGWPDYNEQKFVILFGKDGQTTQRGAAASIDSICGWFYC